MSNTAAWLIDMSELELERVLACGGMARVWLGKWRGLHVAIKQSTLFIDDDYLSEFCREATLMSEMRHPNILQFMGATLHASELFIITELCAHGSLFDVLHGDEIPLLSPHKMLDYPIALLLCPFGAPALVPPPPPLLQPLHGQPIASIVAHAGALTVSYPTHRPYSFAFPDENGVAQHCWW
eukprot:CAMPEP_0175934096 /NCGR_PEP_ID=MMETSP0108-20121206/20298_1 /TAXON_ID=195067 ORGANISM="Goniomonas pacifica, Strain CCMP1869" /NCGR_SAMPLE_ID=MMETSP0108 /ASSEMBLY_ACC=CAM_ASM_000204 /LENGTH=181 /DNA_ID=CAMNT_0017257893 /DNA_START=817 /DNA_END=1360 /DNA_ORIENTATION=+